MSVLFSLIGVIGMAIEERDIGYGVVLEALHWISFCFHFGQDISMVQNIQSYIDTTR